MRPGIRVPAAGCTVASTSRGMLPLVVLVGLVIASPWPFGGVHPSAARVVALVAAGATVAALAGSGARREPPSAGGDLGSIALLTLALWLLGALQLLPLPPALHAAIAPGSAGVWHPIDPFAAAVLGSGPHPISVHPAATARWVAFFGAVAGLAMAAVPALRGRDRHVGVSVAVVLSAMAVALYAFVARLWLGDLLFGRYESLVRPFGPFVSKNHFSGYVEMAALLAVGLASGLAAEARERPGALGWIESPRASRVVTAWAAAAVLVLAVPVSLSRGGVLSLAAGLVTFLLLRATSSRRTRGGFVALGAGLGAVTLLAGALAFVLPASARARIGTIAQGGGDGSSAYRVGLWRDTLRLAASSPLVGSGLGAYADAIPRFKEGAGDVRVEHAESDILQVTAESGLLGVSLVAAALVLAFRTGWRRVRQDPHRVSRAIRTGGLAALAALAAHSCLDFNLRIPSNALLAALLAALVLSPVSSDEDGTNASTRSVARLIVGAGASVIAIIVALTVSWTDSLAFADGLSLRTGALRRSTAERGVVSHLRKRPADARAWLLLAWLRLPSAPDEAAALARQAVRSDPADARVSDAARGLTGR